MNGKNKKILVFAPCAYDMAETTRMIEIAKGIRHHELASKVFDIQFIADGGNLEHLIEEEGFPLKKMEPRLTEEQIQHIAEVDRGEKFSPALPQKELIEKIENEVEYFKGLKPTAVVTGSYMTISVTCRILHIPLVWVIQSTWLEGFFTKGAGMTDGIKFKPIKIIADWMILLFINFWIRIGFLSPINKAAKHFSVDGYKSIFEFWRGDINLVAEPAEFSGAELPPNYYYIGPLIARQHFPVPGEVRNIRRDKPLIYFAMGSSGTPEIVANILEGFDGKPYRVIAPIKPLLGRVPGTKIPSNVVVTDWLPALEINKMADLAVIHGGIGTVMTAAYAGKPVVGVGMQLEQVANIACLVRKGFAIRVPKSRNPSPKVQAAIHVLLNDAEAKHKAEAFSKIMEKWDGPQMAAERLYEKYGKN
jgi:UDP:flavonoid glycosyltransferase YjiC (YdhE family)